MVGREPAWTTSGQQVVDVAPQPTGVHGANPLIGGCGLPQRAVLHYLRVGNADAHLGSRLLDRVSLEEPRLENATVPLGQGSQDPLRPRGCFVGAGRPGEHILDSVGIQT
jgi:hypothetical protein